MENRHTIGDPPAVVPDRTKLITENISKTNTAKMSIYPQYNIHRKKSFLVSGLPHEVLETPILLRTNGISD